MKIFLCVPFSSRVDESGNVDSTYRHVIESLVAELRARGLDVYCALEYAAWKLGGLTSPEDELAQDLAEIDTADKVITLLEEQLSPGVQFESGYAFAKGKVVEAYQLGKAAWSNLAFAKLNGHEIVPVKDIDDFAEKVLTYN